VGRMGTVKMSQRWTLVDSSGEHWACAALACIGVRPPNASLDWRTGQSGVCGMARPWRTSRPRRSDGPVSCPKLAPPRPFTNQRLCPQRELTIHVSSERNNVHIY